MKFRILLFIGIIIFNYSNAQTCENVGDGLTESIGSLIVNDGKLFGYRYNQSDTTETICVWDGSVWNEYTSAAIYIKNIVVNKDTLFASTNEAIYFWNNNLWEEYYSFDSLDIEFCYSKKLFVFKNDLYILFICQEPNYSFYKLTSDSLYLKFKTDGGDIADVYEYNDKLYLTGCFLELYNYNNGVYTGTSIYSPHFAYYDGENLFSANGGLSAESYGLTLTEYNGLIYIGKTIYGSADTNIRYLQTWNGTMILPATYRPNESITSLKTIDNKMYAHGSFTKIGETELNHFGVWDGISWSDLGLNIISGEIGDIIKYDGKLYITGSFEILEGNDTIRNIAVINENDFVEDLDFSNNISVYPNPVIDYIKISFSENVKQFKFELFDLQGRLLLTKENEDFVDMKSFGKGIYLYSITIDNRTKIGKLVKN